MKKFCLVVSVAITLGLFSVTSSFAFEDLKISIGAKAWNANWNTFTVGQSSKNIGGSLEVKGAEETVLIPALTIKYKNFFLGGSYYKNDFKFKPTTINTVYLPDSYDPGLTAESATFDLEAEREEYDVTLGYYIFPQLAATIGYKTINCDLDYKYNYRYAYMSPVDPSFNADFSGSYTGKQTDEFTGPFVGLNYSAAFNSWLAGYGTFAYGKLKEKFKEVGWIDESGDAEYISCETGLVFVPAKWASVVLSYRFQTIESNAKTSDSYWGQRGEDGEDRMRGFMLGANFTF